MKPVLVMQDGADFYIENEAGELIETFTAPFKVKDFDMDAANSAREYFVNNHCEPRGYAPIWDF